MPKHISYFAACLFLGMLFACSNEQSNEAQTDDVVAEQPLKQSQNDLKLALRVITIERLQEHLNYLADDALNGRMTGTTAYEKAATYVAEQFAAIGLRPGGDDAGWFQQVPLHANRIDIDSATFTLHKDGVASALTWKEQFVMSGDAVRAKTAVTAEVIFAGYGIHAPEMGYSDFDGFDLEGKIVAIFGGAPASFPHNERAYYSSSRTKGAEIAKRGIVGVIDMRSRVDQGRRPWEVLVMNAGVRPDMSWVDEWGKTAHHHASIEGRAKINEAASFDFFSGTPISFEDALDAADDGRPMTTPLGIEATLQRQTAHELISSPNVVGILEGSDPKLAKQYVIYSAHLDHLGTGVAENGDSIYNGYYDNAMGTSLLIETARAFAKLHDRPRRSILFIALTGEERGLLGSDYFAKYPTVEKDGLIANVNLDMPMLLFPVADIVGFGAEHSSLQEVIEATVSQEGFVLTPDPVPEEVLFVRSDQFSFVREGIPAVFLVPGFTSTDPDIDGQTLFQDHIQNHYHRPSDDSSRPVDWPSALRFARANVRIGYAVASSNDVPTWNDGDFFGEKFAR